MQTTALSTQQMEASSAVLCKACGLCCTGHLFINAELKPFEVESTQALGIKVLNHHPEKPLFCLPCPLWEDHCTIYTHPQKPGICSDFRCKLLKEMQNGQLALDTALSHVRQTKGLIQELQEKLEYRQGMNFRQALLEQIKEFKVTATHTSATDKFRLKAGVLLVLFTQRFGDTGLFNRIGNAKSK